MSVRRRDDEAALERFYDGLAESLIESSDEEILEEVRAGGEDPDEVAEHVREVLLNAIEWHRLALEPPARGNPVREIARRWLRRGFFPLPSQQRPLLEAVLGSAQGLTLQYHDFKSLHDEDVAALLRQLEEVGAVEAFLGDDDG